LHAEQGFGDTIHFVRYARLVKERGGRVVVGCPKALVPLVATCPGIDEAVASISSSFPFDVQAPLLSLPGILRTTLDTIPAQVPYLFPDATLVKRWQQELGSLAGFKVGIAWHGNPTHENDRHRSIPLDKFAPLARVPNIRLLSLQKGPGAEQVPALAGRFEVISLGPLQEASWTFMDTAAVMMNLDLVLCVDTAPAHLAGALGRPVWVLLPAAPDWRWLLGRDDSPWYPTMRLFRQSQLGDWDEVLQRVAQALHQTCGDIPPVQPIRVEIAPGELIDKITILEIKSERISDAAKLQNVRKELADLVAVRERALTTLPELTRLTAELKAINEALWQIEDDLRECERRQDFGADFIALARSVYQHNDRRAAVKRRINDLCGSRIIEEKSYRPYR
jgi:hypothetical protein